MLANHKCKYCQWEVNRIAPMTWDEDMFQLHLKEEHLRFNVENNP